jgi:DNA adenine methylase
VEVFGGGGSLLLAKEPSPLEVYNDIHSGVVNFYRVLRDNQDELIAKLRLTPFSREEFYYCRDNWKSCTDPVEKARMWFTCAIQRFSGSGDGGWRYAIFPGKKSNCVDSWHNNIERVLPVAARFASVIIEQRDFRKLLETYNHPDICLYLDPPYVPESRIGGSHRYEFEMSVEHHREMLDMLIQHKGKILLSSYDNPLYQVLAEHGWTRIDYGVTASSLPKTCTGRLRSRMETLWLNSYSPPPFSSSV